MSKLFTPLRVGRLALNHRITMAPMTRLRADSNHVPLPSVKDYYQQRAAAPGTLLITEATVVSPRHGGYANVPGIYTDAQTEAWERVTRAVHEKGSYIYLQLWALGRTANPQFMQQQGFDDILSSSDVPMKSLFSGETHYPRPMTASEIYDAITDFEKAAKNAIKAGFDGVEIHGANGYLVDQFIQDVSNKRTDSWGGSVPNRSRFAFEVTSTVAEAVGHDRTAIRLSPWSRFQEMRMADPVPQFSHLIKSLADLNLSYVHLCESEQGDSLHPFIDSYPQHSPLMVAGNYTPESAVKAVDMEYKDNDVTVAFGRPYISNPDLPFRAKQGIPFAPLDPKTMYAQCTEGYSDYKFSGELKANL